MTLHVYQGEFNDQVISVWERSVRATHHFLKPEDIDYYKSIVTLIDFRNFTVYCAFSDTHELAGFVGLDNQKVEMLFVDPTYIGKGVGKFLMTFAMDELNATILDVNEQNVAAVDFYTRLGFVVYERSATDNEGKAYPVLKMKRIENNRT